MCGILAAKVTDGWETTEISISTQMFHYHTHTHTHVLIHPPTQAHPPTHTHTSIPTHMADSPRSIAVAVYVPQRCRDATNKAKNEDPLHRLGTRQSTKHIEVPELNTKHIGDQVGQCNTLNGRGTREGGQSQK